MFNRLSKLGRAWAHSTIGTVLLVSGWNTVGAQPMSSKMPMLPQSPPPRFKIDPDTPLNELLPPAPVANSQEPSAFVKRLADVPELSLFEHVPKGTSSPKVIDALALQMAKIEHLNKQKSDRFVEALATERADLVGLPFQMGTGCRLESARSRYFKQAVAMVHRARDGDDGQRKKAATGALEDGNAFLFHLQQACLAEDNLLAPSRTSEFEDHASASRVAALTQICGPTTDTMKSAVAKYIASVSTVDSTHALAKLILFTPEENARNIAIEALKARREKDYSDLLLQGFRYPWPDVAQRAADALVKLDRKDLVTRIIDVLDEADPRAPVIKTVNGKTTTTVREVVRINHLRNCLMCHPPGQHVQDDPDILTTAMPIPTQELAPSITGGYAQQSTVELLIRIDVTYLRQDFSMMLRVADAAPWPARQRFDFVVRTRTLKDNEVKTYKNKFDKLEPGELPPNHKAALAALRELTGKDTAPTADAWRKLAQVTK